MSEYQQVLDPMTGQASEKIVQRTSDQAFIPFDDANRDYVEYKKWLDEGNQPSPPPNAPKATEAKR